MLSEENPLVLIGSQTCSLLISSMDSPFVLPNVFSPLQQKNDLKSDCFTRHLLKAHQCLPIEHRIKYKLLTKACKEGVRERVRKGAEC